MTLVFGTPTERGFIGLLKWINTITQGAFGIMFLVIIFGASFLTMKAFGNKKSLGVSMFITSFIGILLRILQVVSDYVLLASIIFFIISFVILKMQKDQFS